MTTQIEVKGLKELIARMEKYPSEMKKAQQVTVDASLLVLWENVPSYPRISFDSTYERTGTLGKTLGSGSAGGKAGNPDILESKAIGSGWEGRFGTRLKYAPYVIGDTAQAAHMGYWWQMKDIAEKSNEKIVRLFNIMADKLALFLEGKK